jgi:DNA mismatch repair protein MutS2
MEAVATAREQLVSAATELKSIHRELRAPLKPAVEAPPPLKLARGQRVWLRGVERPGILVTPPDDSGEIEVQFGALRMKAGQERVEKVEEAKLEPGPAVALSTRPTSPPPLELLLRGWRAEQVAPELERYLNDAFMAHLPRVRIVHGKGTGTLRQIVRDMLSNHPLVKSFGPAPPSEGGDGATMVELATWSAT